MRKKIDARKLAYTLTEEDVKEAIMQEKIRVKLGLYDVYDSTYTESKEYVPSMYSSIDAYEYDKYIAENLILFNKPIPKELEDKLIRARLELENIGLLEPYTE